MTIGRYSIQAVLRAHVGGAGTYLVIDHFNGTTAILKTASRWARPAVSRLESEYRRLGALSVAGVAPAPIELARDADKVWLAREYAEGESLRKFALTYGSLMSRDPSGEYREWYRDRLYRMWVSIALMVDRAHRAGVHLGRPTGDDVLITNLDLGRVILIRANALASGQAHEGERVDELRRSDYRTMGALIADTLAPVRSALGTGSPGHLLSLRSTATTVGLPQKLVDLLARAVSTSSKGAPEPHQIVSACRSVRRRPLPGSAQAGFGRRTEDAADQHRPAVRNET